MAYDFAKVGFGCLRNPTRPKSYRAPLVGARRMPNAWGDIGCPVVLGHNDTLGSCVPTAGCNAVMPLRWAAGNREIIPDSVPLEIYSTVGPYRGTPATDKGMDPIVLFKWWLTNQIGGYRLAGWHDIDPSDELVMRETIVDNLSIFAVQSIRSPQETQAVWMPDGGDFEGLHATAYNRFVGDLSWSACWGSLQAADQEFIGGPNGQVLDLYALDLVAA